MKKYNLMYFKKIMKISFGLYIAMAIFLCLDAVVLSKPAAEVVSRALVLLPLLILCLIFSLSAYKGFERSVRKEEKKHNTSFVDEGFKLIDKKHLIFFSSEWIIFAGREALHFGSVAEVTDPFGGTDLKIIGSKYRSVVVSDKKKRYVIGSNDPTVLQSLKTAYLKYKDEV